MLLNNNQEIIFEDAILFQLAVPEIGNYVVQFSLIGVGVNSGYGSWSNNWNLILNDNKLSLNNVQPLIGSGTYQSLGNPSVSSLLGNLQINIDYPDNNPFPSDEPSQTSWEGNITLSGGSVLGVLTIKKTTGSPNTGSPNIYSVNGTYQLKCENCKQRLYIQNLRIF
jgi:hypothetical protein